MVSDEATSLFESTAEYYAAYRPGYNERVFDYLNTRFDRAAATDRALDVGCGTGEIAIPLAASMDEVIALDPNEAMLEQARAKASAASQSNIDWRHGSDASLPDMTGPFHLATLGRSFHWMNQDRTLTALFRMLEPSGGIALLGNTEWLVRGTEYWQDEIYALVTEFLNDVPERTGPLDYDDPWDEMIDRFGFTNVETLSIRVTREWTIDEIIGYLFSLSYCSPTTHGAAKTTFEDAVRERLEAMEEDTFVQHDTETVITGIRPHTD